jgi:hypothetical protein
MELQSHQIDAAVVELLMRINARDNDPRVYESYSQFWNGRGREILQRGSQRFGTDIDSLVRIMIWSLNRVCTTNGRRPVDDRT